MQPEDTKESLRSRIDVLLARQEEMRTLIVEQAEFIATWKPYAGRDALEMMRGLAKRASALTGDYSLWDVLVKEDE